MSIGLWIYVVMAVIVLLVYTVAIYVAWWALFGDRGRGRRRCPRCWHDLSHTPGMRCNECGFTAGRETDFTRTRRKWTVAVLAVASCVATAGWVYWRLADRSWTAYAPTPILTAILPFAQDVNGRIVRELNGRAFRGNLDSEQWASLLHRCARGDWWSRPVGDRWREKYGPLIIAGRRRIAREEDLVWDVRVRDRLLDLPPHIQLTTRKVWPTGADPHFYFRMDEWWPEDAPSRITLRPRSTAGDEQVFYRARNLPWWSAMSFEVQGVAPSAQEIVFDVTVERREVPEPDPDGEAAPLAEAPETEWQLMSEQTVSVPIRFELPNETVFVPNETLDLTEAVWDTFKPGIVRFQGGPSPVRFQYARGSLQRDDFEGVAIGVQIELMRGEQVARRLDMWWLAGPRLEDRPAASDLVLEDLELLTEVEESTEWSLRITGSPALALRAGDADAYWAGQITLPVIITDRQYAAQPRRWWSSSSGERP